MIVKKLISDIPVLDSQGLKKFSFLAAGFIALVFGVLFTLIFDRILIWPWVFAATLILWANIHAKSLNPLYKLWMLIGGIFEQIISFIILLFLFYLLITPIGLIIQIKNRKKSHAGWIISQNKERSHFEKPY